MAVMMIRVKRVGKSIFDDLKSIGFTQINEISLCYDGSMIVVHRDFGTKKSTDLVVSKLEDAEKIIEALKEKGMYISSHLADNQASGDFINVEGKKCKS